MLHELAIHQVELELQNAQLRATERELAAARDRYIQLFDLAPIGYAAIDAKGAMREVNLRLAQWFGSSQNTLVGWRITAFLEFDDAAPAHKLLRELFDLGSATADVRLPAVGGRPARDLQLEATRVRPGLALLAVLDRSAEARARELEVGFARRLLEARELERERVARKLHDEVGQLLSAVGFGLRSLEQSVDPEVAGRLHSLRELQAKASATTRRLARGLYTTTVEDLGLTRALEALIRDTQAATDLTLTLERSRADLDDLPLGVARLVYAVAQEGLSNALRHAGAGSVALRLVRSPEVLFVEFWDDGVGFDVKAVEAGLGLRSLGSRAQSLGGSLEIDAAPGEGTTLRLRLPLA
jgi:signal transduction histidine kinase